MKPIVISVLLAASGICTAADITLSPLDKQFQVERMPFGSGTPANASTDGTQTANHVVDGLYHVPNYLPGFPTAATIWPRELPIDCESDSATGKPTCTGYRVLPAVGRGEYIFIRPVVKAVVPPVELEPRKPEPAPVPVTRKKPLG